MKALAINNISIIFIKRSAPKSGVNNVMAKEISASPSESEQISYRRYCTKEYWLWCQANIKLVNKHHDKYENNRGGEKLIGIDEK